MNSTKNTGILGLGIGLPSKVLTNKDLEEMVDTTDEWIVTRTGIRERRILAEDELPSDIATKAGLAAIEDAGLTVNDIDALFVLTFTPDKPMPMTATIVQAKMGLPKIMCMDINAACTAFVYALYVADQMVKTGALKHPLIIGADCASRYLDYTDRQTCILFGDGAGAVVLGQVDAPRGLLGHHVGADGYSGHNIQVEGGGAAAPMHQNRGKQQFIQMQGREVFKFAVRALGEAVDNALADAGMKTEEIDLLVPHQANIRIIESAAQRFGKPMDQVIVNVDRYGNTSSASIPLALQTAKEQGRLKDDQVLALVAFGGGLTYGANILRWGR